MKKLYLLLLIPFYLFGLTINQEVVDNYIQKENVIRNYIVTYLYETGHLPTSKEELNNYFNIEENLYMNIYGENDAIEIKTSNEGITLNNIISTDITKINDNVKYYYKNSVYLPTGLIISEDYSSNYLSYDSKTKSVINFINNLLDYEYVGVTEPDTSIYTSWYYPNGDGTFTLRKYDGTKWYLTNNNTPLTQYTYTEDSFDPDSSCTNDDTAKVFGEDGSITNYVCISGKWVLMDSATGTTLFNGYTDLHSLVCNMWDKAGSSTVYDIPVLPFSGEKKTFTKYDDSDENHDGYWISEDGKDIVTKNMKDLVWYRSKYGTQQTGYMCYNNNVIIAKWLGIGSSHNWVYLTSNYLDMYDNYKLNITDWNNNNNYYLSWNYQIARDNEYKKIFQYDGTVYYSKYKFVGDTNSISDITVQVGYNKNIFRNFVDDTFYLTKIDNCSVDNNCFGTTTSQFNGNMIDNMYVFLYDTHNKMMVDARFIYNSSDIYNLMNNAVYYNKDIYYKKQDLNGVVCYQREDGKWITDDMYVIPDMYIVNGKPTFPVGINCQNVNFTSDNVMILNNRTELANWFSANIGTVAKVNGVTSYYTKMAKGDKDYWSNSSENISGYSRYDLPYASNNSKNYLTKYLGTKGNLEDPNKLYRFNDNGLRSNVDSSFYNWFATPTSKSINNMIDGDCQNVKYTSNPCDAKYNNKQFKFNNSRCEIDISNSECPIINGIQTIYDSSRNICYISIPEDNTYCSDKSMVYSKTLNMCYRKINDNDCEGDMTWNSSENKCEKILYADKIKTIGYDKTKFNIWAGKIGDNYIAASCGMYHYSTSFYVNDISKVTKFTLKKAKFDDWIAIYLNGKLLRVGPYGGTMLSIIRKTTYSLFKTIQYDVNKYGACELRTSWNQDYNIEAKDYLINGTNKIDIYIVVAGHGEGYAYFEGASSISNNMYCSSTYCKEISYLKTIYICPTGYIDNGDNCKKIEYYPLLLSNIKLDELIDNTRVDILIDENIQNPDPENLDFNKYKDRFETKLKSLNINNLEIKNTFNSEFQTYLENNKENFLNYDYTKNKIYYNISDSLCSYTHMIYDVGLDTPYYPYSDGNCYSDLGKACVDSGFVQTQNF